MTSRGEEGSYPGEPAGARPLGRGYLSRMVEDERPGGLAVEARGVTKRYDGVAAVQGIDFDVGLGECVGFLGPNGAGKTTTVRMVSCFTPVGEGTIRVFGLDVAEHPREVKRQIGVCPQEDNLDTDLGVERNLLVYARYFDIPPAEAKARTTELLRLLQLEEKRRARIMELSGGMKRRLVLARALLNRPRLLVLDEPTTGLDPQARHLIWNRVEALKAEGTAILLTTHYMEEAEKLCDRVILMDRGRVLLEGEPPRLVEREVGREVLEVWNHEEALVRFVEEQGWEHESYDRHLYVYLPAGTDAVKAVDDRFPHQEHRLRLATLEDVFLRRAGRALQD